MFGPDFTKCPRNAWMPVKILKCRMSTAGVIETAKRGEISHALEKAVLPEAVAFLAVFTDF